MPEDVLGHTRTTRNNWISSGACNGTQNHRQKGILDTELLNFYNFYWNTLFKDNIKIELACTQYNYSLQYSSVERKHTSYLKQSF